MGSASDAQTLHEAMAPHPPKGNLGETNRIRMGPTFQIWPAKSFLEGSLSSTRPACSRTKTPHGSLGQLGPGVLARDARCCGAEPDARAPPSAGKRQPRSCGTPNSWRRGHRGRWPSPGSLGSLFLVTVLIPREIARTPIPGLSLQRFARSCYLVTACSCFNRGCWLITFSPNTSGEVRLTCSAHSDVSPQRVCCVAHPWLGAFPHYKIVL